MLIASGALFNTEHVGTLSDDKECIYILVYCYIAYDISWIIILLLSVRNNKWFTGIKYTKSSK